MRSATHTRKCSLAAAAWSSSVCNLWHHPIASRKPLQSLQKETATRDIIVGNIFQDRRQPGRPRAAKSQPTPLHQPLFGSQSIPQGDPFDDSPLPNSPIPDFVITERDAQLPGDLYRASAMAILRSIVSWYGMAWAESLEGALNGHQSWAILCRYHCRLLQAEVPKGSDRNTEYKKDVYRCEKREKFTVSLEEFWASRTLGNKAGKREPCSRRPKNSVVKELVPSQPEDQFAKPRKDSWVEQQRARQNVESTGPQR